MTAQPCVSLVASCELQSQSMKAQGLKSHFQQKQHFRLRSNPELGAFQQQVQKCWTCLICQGRDSGAEVAPRIFMCRLIWGLI